jgi:hypothetical protein
MEKTITQNELVKFLYDETNEVNRQELINELILNPELFSELMELNEVRLMLNRELEKPNDKIHQRLLNFSKSIETFDSKLKGEKSVWIMN